MARTTVKDLETRVNGIEAKIDQLIELAAATAQAKQPKQAKQADERPWWGECPEYATASQRVEWQKLVKKAKATRDKVAAAAGTECIKCFIPVPKKQDLMPHSINWKVSYK